MVNTESGNNGDDTDGNDDYISDDGYADIADPTQRICKRAHKRCESCGTLQIERIYKCAQQHCERCGML